MPESAGRMLELIRARREMMDDLQQAGVANVDRAIKHVEMGQATPKQRHEIYIVFGDVDRVCRVLQGQFN